MAFSRLGFSSASLEDIARSLGVTKAALYHYFPNKSSLFKACCDQALDDVGRTLQNAQKSGTDGRSKLRLLMIGYIEWLIDPSTVAMVEMQENALDAADRAAVDKARDSFERGVENLVREGMKDGSIVPCDPKLVVFVLFGAANWIPRWYRQGGSWSTAQLAEAVAEMIERALSTSPSKELTLSVSKSARSAARARA